MSKARPAPLICQLGVKRKSVTKRSQKTDEQAAIGHYGTHKHMSSVESPEAAYRDGGHSPV